MMIPEKEDSSVEMDNLQLELSSLIDLYATAAPDDRYFTSFHARQVYNHVAVKS